MASDIASLKEDIEEIRDLLQEHILEDVKFHTEAKASLTAMNHDLYGNGQPGFMSTTSKEIIELKTLIAKYAGIGIGIASLAGVLSHLLEKLW